MGYKAIYQTWLPYALMKDKRGFISMRFGGTHTGIDSVGNQASNPVCAVLDGKVFNTRNDPKLGNVVEYGAGNVRIAYYHLAKISVCSGDTVVAGRTQIGVEGATGSLARGKHLHTSIWINGQLVDPEPYLNGTKKFSEEAHKMYREVTKELNLRESASLNAKVKKALPVGTLIEVVKNDGEWGRVIAFVGGQSIDGYCKLATTWSKEIV